MLSELVGNVFEIIVRAIVESKSHLRLPNAGRIHSSKTYGCKEWVYLVRLTKLDGWGGGITSGRSDDTAESRTSGRRNERVVLLLAILRDRTSERDAEAGEENEWKVEHWALRGKECEWRSRKGE